MILSGDEIVRNLGTNIVIEPFDDTRLNPNSYNLTLHDELMTYEEVVLDMAEPNRTRRIKIPKEGLVLTPQKLYLGRTAERTMLLALCAGCLAPVGALAVVQGERLSLAAVVLTPDGRRRIHAGAATATNEAVYLGQIIAEELLAAGAAEMIAAAHGGSR